MRYIVDKYNQRPDPRLGDQTRYQRWEAGLIASPNVISEEELCGFWQLLVISFGGRQKADGRRQKEGGRKISHN
ncbi:hypothetical protein [Nostoc sp. C117]|uniref:hypothetical protein n=1 Tax=Nostoc sp. C117 TaxID=3349875 RepID=UPI00370D11C5